MDPEAGAIRHGKGALSMITRRDEQVLGVREFMRGGKKQVNMTELSAKLPGKRMPSSSSRRCPRGSKRLRESAA